MSHESRYALRLLSASPDTLDALDEIARMMGGIDALDLDVEINDCDALDLDVGGFA